MIKLGSVFPFQLSMLDQKWKIWNHKSVYKFAVAPDSSILFYLDCKNKSVSGLGIPFAVTG